MGPSAVAGTVALDTTGEIATFTPGSNLLLNTVYTATITTGAKDLWNRPEFQNCKPFQGLLAPPRRTTLQMW